MRKKREKKENLILKSKQKRKIRGKKVEETFLKTRKD